MPVHVAWNLLSSFLGWPQVDLINYGLIPEFVGRFPIICGLQARLHPPDTVHLINGTMTGSNTLGYC